MKIALTGTTSIGKSTLINDFIKNWRNYGTPQETYRDILKQKNLKHSSQSSEETQQIVLEFLLKQLETYSKEPNVIFDRCPLDNLAYTSWLNLKGKASDKFLDETRIAVRESMRKLDIIFYLPITTAGLVPIVNDGFRDIDPIMREEVDNIFKAMQISWHSGDGRIAPENDSPALIEIYGNPQQRIEMIKLYLNEKGEPFGEEQSLIADPSLYSNLIH
ncbi:MAG: ATP-binding protein [Chloroflexota bacterium]